MHSGDDRLDSDYFTRAERLATHSGLQAARDALAGIEPPPAPPTPAWKAQPPTAPRGPASEDPVVLLKRHFPGAVLVDDFGRPLPGEATAAKQAIAAARRPTPLPQPDLFDQPVTPTRQDRSHQEAT